MEINWKLVGILALIVLAIAFVWVWFFRGGTAVEVEKVRQFEGTQSRIMQTITPQGEAIILRM